MDSLNWMADSGYGSVISPPSLAQDFISLQDFREFYSEGRQHRNNPCRQDKIEDTYEECGCLVDITFRVRIFIRSDFLALHSHGSKNDHLRHRGVDDTGSEFWPVK